MSFRRQTVSHHFNRIILFVFIATPKTDRLPTYFSRPDENQPRQPATGYAALPVRRRLHPKRCLFIKKAPVRCAHRHLTGALKPDLPYQKIILPVSLSKTSSYLQSLFLHNLLSQQKLLKLLRSYKNLDFLLNQNQALSQKYQAHSYPAYHNVNL